MATDDAEDTRHVQQLPEPVTTSPGTGSRENRPTSAGVASVTASQRTEDTEQIRRAVAQLERENRRLRKRCEEAEIEINHLERSLKNAENTLSFRLGYALIHSTKSLDALRSLPTALLELSRDSRRRRRDPSQANVLLAVVRSAVAGAVRLSRIRDKSAETSSSKAKPEP